MVTTTQPTRSTLGDLGRLAGVPDAAALQAHYDAGRAAARGRGPVTPGPGGHAYDRESPEDRVSREQAREQARAAVWATTRPSRYRTAALADLGADQFAEPAGRVRALGWLERPDSRAMILAGDPGIGKTHTAYALGNAAHTAGTWVAGTTAADLMASMRPDSDDPRRYIRATRCQLLILDDLGRESVTGWVLEQLQRLLDDRTRGDGRMVLTTNLGAEAIRERYGAPILDRLLDGATVIRMAGKSRRRQYEW